MLPRTKTIEWSVLYPSLVKLQNTKIWSGLAIRKGGRSLFGPSTKPGLGCGPLRKLYVLMVTSLAGDNLDRKSPTTLRFPSPRVGRYDGFALVISSPNVLFLTRLCGPLSYGAASSERPFFIVTALCASIKPTPTTYHTLIFKPSTRHIGT